MTCTYLPCFFFLLLPSLAIATDFERGVEALEKGQDDETIAFFNAQLREHSKNAPAYYCRGIAYNRKKDWDKDPREEAGMSGETDVPGKSDEAGGPGDRRAWVRYPCRLEASCRTPDSACTAWARDISTHGLGLTLRQRIEPETVLSIQLLTAGSFGDRLAARVVHVEAQASGGWLVGCAWLHPFSEAELRALV